MTEIVELFLSIISFLFIIFIIRVILVVERLKQQNNEQRLEEVEKIIHIVDVEEHHDQIYWFDKKNNSFIVQGKNVDEIVDKLKMYFSDHVFVFSLNNSDKEFYQLSGPDWIIRRRMIQNG